MNKDYMTELKESLKNVRLDIEIDKIDPDKDLDKQGVDSMDNINMLFAIEDYFAVNIPDDALISGKLSTVNKIIEFIRKEKYEK